MFSLAAMRYGCDVHQGMVMDLSKLRSCIVLHAYGG